MVKHSQIVAEKPHLLQALVRSSTNLEQIAP
jgi:hypothetical protein